MTILLHGFWGQPRDWNAVLANLPLASEVWAPDLYTGEGLTPQHDFESWSYNLLQHIRSHSDRPVQIVGYSLGGRLALHALMRAPDVFSRALLLSTRAHLAESERRVREAWEEQWAQRFREDQWDALAADWQEQPVFVGSPGVERRQSTPLREGLATSLKSWSLTRHRFAPEDLRRLPATVEWAYGALDQKCLADAKFLQELPVAGQITLIPKVGHRLTVEASDFVADWISRGENHG